MKQKNLILSDSAISSIDLIIAMAFFFLGLIFVLITIATMFTPYQTEAVDTQAVAFRASNFLAEDPGVKSLSGSINRSGLALNKFEPNVLPYYKIYQLRSLNYTQLRETLGLYQIINDKKIYYDFNLTITDLNNTQVFLQVGNIPPIEGDVNSISRIVNILFGEYAKLNGLIVPFPTSPAANTKVIIGVVGHQYYDIGIVLEHTQLDTDEGILQEVKFSIEPSWSEMMGRATNPGGAGGGKLFCSNTTNPDDYVVWINDTFAGPANRTDQPNIRFPNNSNIKMLFNASLFNDPSKNMEDPQFFLIEIDFQGKHVVTVEAAPFLWNIRESEGELVKGMMTLRVWR